LAAVLPYPKIIPMFRNYFTTALRGLRTNKTYSSINITGLALSLAVSILLLLWVNDELSYDRFNVNAGLTIYTTAIRMWASCSIVLPS